MIYSASPLAVAIFLIFVLFVLGMSFYFAGRTKSTKDYYSAGGSIHWAVNGIAFAGDYLSAASFLGICGMIAVAGYDGFLYSIGYLAGWVVALFVVAEPLKRLGKFTFADALDFKFNSKGVQLMAGVSTLVVSLFYLIPQMVGAGVLVTPLLGLPHWVGVVIVGSVVIFIVSTAGMKSTTYVQFLKGGLLIVFSVVLVVLVLKKGASLNPSEDYHKFMTLNAKVSGDQVISVDNSDYKVIDQIVKKDKHFVKLSNNGIETWWTFNSKKGILKEALSKTTKNGGEVLYNGAPKEEGRFYSVGHMNEIVVDGKRVDEIKNLNPVNFLSIIQESEVVSFKTISFNLDDEHIQVWYQKITPGKDILSPGLKFKIDKGSTLAEKLNFISLMLALFCGTAALPHVLIRFYTVPTPGDARKSTIVAIGAIGFFYILTLFMGLGAMINGVIDPESTNMSAPLLAQSFGLVIFAIISAIAFATVLGTVSGLIVAAAGAVAHDLMNQFMGVKLSDSKKVLAGKLAAIGTGLIAIALGIAFKGMNVAHLVGWAFAVAASANLPAIMMLLFWKKTTSKGIAASIGAGIVSSLGIILLSPSMFERYGLGADSAIISLDNPGIVSIPISFIVLVIVSLLTQKKEK